MRWYDDVMLGRRPHSLRCFHVISEAYNGDHFSALLPTTRKSTLISVHACFSGLLPTMPIIFSHCGPQRRKMISVVIYTAEKLSALLTTMQKNV
jgi:hypothetical protein